MPVTGLGDLEGWKSKGGRPLVEIRFGLRVPNASGVPDDIGRLLKLAGEAEAVAERLRRAGKTKGGFGSGPVGLTAYASVRIASSTFVLIEMKWSTGNET